MIDSVAKKIAMALLYHHDAQTYETIAKILRSDLPNVMAYMRYLTEEDVQDAAKGALHGSHVTAAIIAAGLNALGARTESIAVDEATASDLDMAAFMCDQRSDETHRARGVRIRALLARCVVTPEAP